MLLPSQPRVGSRRAARRRPKSGITRTSRPEHAKGRKEKLTTPHLSARRSNSMLNPPSMSKGGSGSNKNRKLNVCSGIRSEKSASENKKSTESKSNVSEKSASVSRNTNVSVVCVHEKNVNKSASGVCSGMRRSNVSENDALYASKSGWRASLLLLLPHHRSRPGYSLALRLSRRFPSLPNSRPTREKG